MPVAGSRAGRRQRFRRRRGSRSQPNPECLRDPLSHTRRIAQTLEGGGPYGMAGQRLAQVLPASAEQSRPLALGAASKRSWPSDTTDEAPLPRAVSLPTWVQVLPPSRVTYTPPIEPVLGSTLSSDT